MKKAISLFLCIALIFTLCACGTSTTSETPSSSDASTSDSAVAADEPVEITIGHIYASSHAIGQALDLFAEKVNELSDGSITAVVYPASQMGSESEILQQVDQGALDMTVSGGGMYAGYVPAASVFESLCMFTDGTQQVQIIDEMGGLDFFNEVMADSNFVAVGWMSGGSRNVLSTVPVRTADDFKGFNIRVPDNQVYVDIFKTLGCNSIIVSWSEGYTAMQTGMVSAIEAGTETLATANLQEVADYYTITGHINVTNFCSMNKDKWNSLSENQQNAVIEAMKLANELQLSLSEENEQVYRDKFVEAGIEIIELSSDDIAKLQESVSGIVTSTAESYGFADKVAELRSCLG